MSTRSNIALYTGTKPNLLSPDILLYRHSDGYPDAVLPDLIPFLKRFAKARGWDEPDYMAARLIQHMCNLDDAACSQFNSSRKKYENCEWSLIGYGIDGDRVFYADIEYAYAIKPKFRLEVYKTVFDLSQPQDPKRWRKLGSFDVRTTTVRGAVRKCRKKMPN